MTHYTKKQRLFSAGSVPMSLFFIEQGKVKLFQTNQAGNEYITALLGPGDFMGYVALLEVALSAIWYRVGMLTIPTPALIGATSARLMMGIAVLFISRALSDPRRTGGRVFCKQSLTCIATPFHIVYQFCKSNQIRYSLFCVFKRTRVQLGYICMGICSVTFRTFAQSASNSTDLPQAKIPEYSGHIRPDTTLQKLMFPS